MISGSEVRKINKKLIILGALFFFIFIFLFSGDVALQAEEITLFNYEGEPVAYIAIQEDFTIYLWDGEPVAYLHEESNNIHIYAFDGEHLGWYESGIIIDHDGDAAGFVEGALNVPTKFEPFKGIKKIKPIKGIKQIPPIKPTISGKWSLTPLQVFLTLGIAEPAILVENINNGNEILILRSNGEAWLLDAITWCSWAWQYEGDQIWINFGFTRTEVANIDGQTSEFWTKSQIEY